MCRLLRCAVNTPTKFKNVGVGMQRGRRCRRDAMCCDIFIVKTAEPVKTMLGFSTVVPGAIKVAGILFAPASAPTKISDGVRHTLHALQGSCNRSNEMSLGTIIAPICALRLQSIPLPKKWQ